MTNKYLEITRTTWNGTALMGWFSVIAGLICMGGQLLLQPSALGFAFGAFSLVGGGVVVSMAGKVKTTTTHKVRLSKLQE